MQLDNFSNTDQVIIWNGKPEFKPYIIDGLLSFIRSLAFGVFVLTLFILFSKVGKFNLSWTSMALIALIIIFDSAVKLIRKTLEYRNTIYRITDKRVYIQKGILKTYLKEIEKDKIKHIDTTTSKAERKYNVGTVLLWLGEFKQIDDKEEKVFYMFESIQDIDKILRLL